MVLEQALLEIECKLDSLKEEVGTLRHYVAKLEERNDSLTKVLKKKGQAFPSKSNLLYLHDSGFHICPTYFGDYRDGDCLFCTAFLEKEVYGDEDYEDDII